MIYLSITGFGGDGPYTKVRVYDAIIQAVSGMCASHLEKPGDEPGLVATTICDKLTSMTAAQAAPRRCWLASAMARAALSIYRCSIARWIQLAGCDV